MARLLIISKSVLYFSEMIMNYLLQLIRDNFEDFKQIENRFDEATEMLRPYLTDEIDDHTDYLISLSNVKLISVIKHYVLLGIKANMSYFKNP